MVSTSTRMAINMKVVGRMTRHLVMMQALQKTGDVHEGYYENDKRENFGVYLWSNTDKYIGN